MAVDVLAPLRRALSWWNSQEEGKKQTRIAIVALIVAIIALVPIVNDWLASPEEELAKLGYKKTYEDFWRSISNKHTEAVNLFMQAKLRLEPEHFGHLFDDRIFSVDIFNVLFKGNSIDEQHCPTDIKSLKLYKFVAPNPEKLLALRRVCNKPAVIASIRSIRIAEQERITEAVAKNQGRPERVKACVNKYQSEKQKLIKDAIQFDLLGHTTYTEYQCILAHLNTEFLLGGGQLLVNSDQAFLAIIRQCCDEYDPPQQPGDSGIRAADDAIAILGG